jgi:hypothetical protein
MKSIILYAAKPGTGCAVPYWPVYPTSADHIQAEVVIFVRAEIIEADVCHALDMARPKPDEIVLNTILLSEDAKETKTREK